MSFYRNYPQFQSGDTVVSLVFHPPEIVSGTVATIISPHMGFLYAVKLPNGDLHRWLAGFELKPVDRSDRRVLEFGDLAEVISDEGHTPMIKKGMIVKIAKVITGIPFYDLRLENGSYHRWLAEFEITYPI